MQHISLSLISLWPKLSHRLKLAIKWAKKYSLLIGMKIMCCREQISRSKLSFPIVIQEFKPIGGYVKIRELSIKEKTIEVLVTQ